MSENTEEKVEEPKVESVEEVKAESTEIKPEPNKKAKKKMSKKKKIIIAVIVILLIVIAGVVLFFMFGKKKETKTVKNEVKEVYSEYKMTGNDLQDFDLKFLQLETNNQNVIYSPLSIKYALAMLSEGSKGETKAQIDALIGEYTPKKYTNSANMSFANAMFIKNTFKDGVRENYIKKLQEKYNAEVIYDAFENPNNINSWVSDKTFGLINDLVDDVSGNQFFLINALAIDMEWNKLIQASNNEKSGYKDVYSVSYPHENYFDYISIIENERYDTVKFDNKINAKAVEIGASINNYDIINTLGEDNIRKTITDEYNAWVSTNPCGDGPYEDTTTFVNKFINELDSNYKEVEASTDFKFYDDENVKVFSKELKEYNNTTLEYIGIMPKNKALSEYVKESNAKSLNEIISKIKPVELDSFEKGKITKISGGIPLFKYDYELKLMDDLKALGISDAFTGGKADITGIVKDPGMMINQAAHKANIEFSNEGIKAAAATEMGGAGATGCRFDHLYEVPLVEIDLNFDKPYLYIIRDKDSGEVWFTGTVYEPTANINQSARIINEKK